MMPSSFIKSIIWFYFAVIWCVSALAAEPVLAAAAPTVADLPLRALVAAMLLALIGGAARTAQKLADPKVIVHSIYLTIFADVLTSVAVGMATFFLVAWREFSPLLQAFIITVAGYGGSTFLETYVINIVRRFNGSPNNNGGTDAKS